MDMLPVLISFILLVECIILKNSITISPFNSFINDHINKSTTYMRCDSEVPGMILLQAYLYTYSLLRGVIFEVLPLSTCACSPTVLPLVETFLGLLLWISFQCHLHLFFVSSVSRSLCLFKADLIFGNSHKSFGAKSRE
jgi:hypothetical protein